MMKRRVMGVAGLAAMGVAALSGVASAATVGAGDGIEIAGKGGCSVSHVGTVKNGDSKKKVAFTAGHCAQKGDAVYDKDGNRIGTVTHVVEPDTNDINSPDYAVIELDEGTELRGTSKSSGLVTLPHVPANLTGKYVSGGEGENLQFDNFGRPVAKDGATTGRQYGVQLAKTERSTLMIVPVAPGDSGGSVYDPITGDHIGTVSRGNQTFFLLIASNSGEDVDDYLASNEGDTYTMEGSDPETRPAAPAAGLNLGLIDAVSAIPEAPALPELPNYLPAAPAPAAPDCATLKKQAALGVDMAADTAIGALAQARAYAPAESAPVVDGAVGGAVDSVNTARDTALSLLP